MSQNIASSKPLISSSPPSKQGPIIKDPLPEPIALPQTLSSSSPSSSSPLSPPLTSSSQSTITSKITPEVTSDMDTSTDVPSVPVEQAVSLYNPVSSPQHSTTSSEEFSMITSTDYSSEKDENSGSRGKHGFGEAAQLEDYDVPKSNYIKTKISDKAPELTEEIFLPALIGRVGGLSAMAPEFFPVYHESTSIDEAENMDHKYQDVDNSPKVLQEISDPPTFISQISEVAAEVADTAAMLDVTPPEPATPEILSGLDDIFAVNAGSPIVELVAEEPLTPLSEASRVMSEVADTAAMLDIFGPIGGQFIVGADAYATEQTLEEVHIGAIRMIQITEPDDTLASIEEEVVVENCDNLGQDPNGHADIVESTTYLVPASDDYQYISTPEKDKTDLIKDTSGLALPPHLRTKIESRLLHEISDSELSNMSSMSSLSTDQIDIKISSKRFADSIFIEDLVILVSDLYAISWNVPTNAIKCVVDPNPRLGSKNLFYSVELSNKYKIKTNKWIIRIPLSGSDFSSAEESWLKSDIRAMEFIKERTDIPIPFVYGYDFGTQNRIRAPYVIMDFMDGDRVEDVWEAWDDEKKTRCLSQCAESMRKLGSFGFNRIGVLGCDYSKKEYTVHGIPSDTKGQEISFSGPYPSTKAYLDDTWRTKMIELRSSTSSEAVRATQSLVLLKLLVPALVDLGSTTQQFFLSLPEFGGGNVLVDYDGNVTAFVGWEKVMIMPKAMGYTRYPEWITKDWTLAQGDSSATSTTRKHSETTRPKAVPKINRKSLVEASLGSGKIIESVTDDKGIIRGYLLEESEDASEKIILNSQNLAPPPPPMPPSNGRIAEQNHTSRTTLTPQNSINNLSNPTSPKHVPVPTSQLHGDSVPTEISGGRGKQRRKGGGNRSGKGKNWGNNHGNGSQPRQRQNYDYDESIELQMAVTDEDKTKVHALSQWNSLPEKINKDEAEEREERKKAWMAKEETEKVAAIKRTHKLPPVVETFKKVLVEQDQERKLLKVIRTERRGHDNRITDIRTLVLPQQPKPSDMVRYRKIYHEHFTKISPEDELSSKSSHISSAVYTAITNDKLRPSIVPKLAKYVIGETVGPSILGMVGNGQWAKELLMSLDEGKDRFERDVRFVTGDSYTKVEEKKESEYRSVWEILILRPVLIIGVTVVILGASIFLAWALGFAEYHLHSTRSRNGYTALANLRFNLQILSLPQSPVDEATRATAKSVVANPRYLPSDLFDKAKRGIDFIFDYSPGFLVTAIVLMVFLTMQRRYH